MDQRIERDLVKNAGAVVLLDDIALIKDVSTVDVAPQT